MDLKVLSHDYEMAAVCATVVCDQPSFPDPQIAFQKFTNNGVIALLPLGFGSYSLIWSAKRELAQRLNEGSDEDLLSALNDQLSDQKSGITGTITDLLSQVSMALCPGRIYREYANWPELHFNELHSKSRLFYPLTLKLTSRYSSGRVALLG